MNFAHRVRNYVASQRNAPEVNRVSPGANANQQTGNWGYIPRARVKDIWGQPPQPALGSPYTPVAASGRQDAVTDHIGNNPWYEPKDLNQTVDFYGRPSTEARGNFEMTDNPVANRFANYFSGFTGGLNGYGTSPFGGPNFSQGGQTYNPTFWINYPGVGNVPMAVPPQGWGNGGGQSQPPISHFQQRKSSN